MPSLSITAARITEPPVGAWVCASGSHVCTGNRGTFTANATAKAKNSQRPVLAAKLALSAISTRSNVTCPTPLLLARNAVAIVPTSMNAEPNIVNTKNFVAA